MPKTVNLKVVIFFGSARDITPFCGGNKRLGERVVRHVLSTLADHKGKVGNQKLSYDITLYDPLEVFDIENGGALANSGAQCRYPHFAYKPGEEPEAMHRMQQEIRAADCYLIISPEYNHSIPPALSGMMDHFGGSNYEYKPSAIITYSHGPFCGMRCAMALRPFLSELGCSPIPKLVGFPDALNLFSEIGEVEKSHPMANVFASHLPDQLDQLDWYTVALKNMREKVAGP